MRSHLLSCLFAAAVVAVAGSSVAEESKAPAVHGRVLILKEVMPESGSTINAGGLIVVEIPDSGSRPPQDIKVDGGSCVDLGHVRGVATNKEGRSMMGGGYTWYLLSAPADARSVKVEASYLPNGQKEPKVRKRSYQIQIEK